MFRIITTAIITLLLAVSCTNQVELSGVDKADFDTVKSSVNIFNGDTITSSTHLKLAIESEEFDKIQLNDNNQSYSEGTLFYDSAKKALTFYNDLPDFGHQLGYEHTARYYNNTGSTIEDGTFLRPFGQKINGDIFPTVKLAGNGSYDSRGV